MKISPFAQVMSGPRTIVVPLQAPDSAKAVGIELNTVCFADGDRELKYDLPFYDSGRADVLTVKVPGDDGWVEVNLLVPSDYGKYQITTQVYGSKGTWLAVGSLTPFAG